MDRSDSGSEVSLSWGFEEDQQKYSRYFNSCKGVFQGGGCKAIAYIGAYKRAFERGVFFSELAGTSAGSIVAALIAAGATPQKLYEIVCKQDFGKLIKSVGKPNKLQTMLLCPVSRRLPATVMKNISKETFSRFGVFDSAEIEKFVERCLHEITGIHDLKFNQIVPDLNIVCADLKTHRIKIWNKHSAGEESIAKAVSASCSIPVFFTPTDNRYVDGGILSNLPNYLFSKEPHYNRILCFRNQSQTESTLNSVGEYCSSLIETVIGGAIDIQQQFAHESYEVNIDTGDISATDFRRIDIPTINSLVRAGADAMDHFLDDETSFIKTHSSFHIPELQNEEQVHSMVSYLSLTKHDEICVCSNDTYWSWSLFLSVVKWINDRTRVVVFTSKEIKPKYEEEEQSRRRMLAGMGCVLREVDSLPINGFFFSDNGLWSGVTYQKSDDAFNGTYLKNKVFENIIDEILSSLKRKNNVTLTGKPGGKKSTIAIKGVEEDEIFRKLRDESTYASADLKFEDVELSKLTFMNPLIRALKYKQINLMFDMYGNQHIEKFGSAAFVFDNKKESLIGPPLVEEHNNKLYVIEGNTRCVYAYRHGISKLRMVVARGVGKELPCRQDDTSTIGQIIITDKKIKGVDRYKDFDYSLFRHIEKALRPPETYLI